MQLNTITIKHKDTVTGETYNIEMNKDELKKFYEELKVFFNDIPTVNLPYIGGAVVTNDQVYNVPPTSNTIKIDESRVPGEIFMQGTVTETISI